MKRLVDVNLSPRWVLLLTSKVGLQLINQEKIKIDALTGLRYWHRETLNFNTSPYRVIPWALQSGYRYLNVDKHDGVVFKATSGGVFGITLNLK